MALIRALGYHMKPLDLENGSNNFFERLYSFASKIERMCKNFDHEVWTRRVVLPPLSRPDPDVLQQYVDLAEQVAHDNEVDFISFPFSDLDFEKHGTILAEILGNTKKIASSAKIADLGEAPTYAKVMDAVDVLFEIARVAGPEGLTRFALAYGDQPETAYFPDAASREEGFSITLRYVTDLLEKVQPSNSIEDLAVLISKVLKRFDISAKKISKVFETPYLGMDPSLSPWMEESVAGLISKLLGDEFGNLGTYDVINRLNTALERVGSEIRTLGFGEVMLSVAEDNVLKDLCGTGKIQLQQLVSMVSICVAGLDMVAIPLSTPRESLARLLLDTFAIARRKGRPIGVRLLLVPSNPNSYVEIGRFGRVPVLQV